MKFYRVNQEVTIRGERFEAGCEETSFCNEELARNHFDKLVKKFTVGWKTGLKVDDYHFSSDGNRFHCVYNKESDIVYDIFFTEHEVINSSYPSQERLLELTNALIDHVMVGKSPHETIETLLSNGFTKEELINSFGFSKTDVERIID